MSPSVQGSVLVTRGHEVIAEFHGGPADAHVACSPETRFQIASISKQFTAAAILRLAERRALALDDPIGRWVGRCPDSWQPITLHHLLTHSSGLGHWHDYPTIDLTRWLQPEDLLAVFQTQPPRFEPGGGWHYSSPGYVLLAHVVQQAAGEPYRDFLARQVFAPLGMDRTFAGEPGDRDNVARGYAGQRQVRPFELDSVGMGAGDVWSTVDDMRTWIDGLRSGRLLDQGSVRLMFTEHAPTGMGPESRAYGYGWFAGSVAGEEWFHHSGDNAGFKAFNAWLPGSDRYLVALSNQGETDAGIVEKLLSATAGVRGS